LYGTTSALSTIFIVIPFVSSLAKKVGKKRAFIIATSISLVGFLMKWWCFNPKYSSLFVPNLPFIGDIQVLILLPAIFISFGIGSVFMLLGSMMGDVCDLDELNNGKRCEGMFGAIYWWMVKLGTSVAFALSGHILNATGFNVAFGARQPAETLLKLRLFDISFPILTSLLAILAIASYGITEERAGEIRLALEQNRGEIA
jgi:GPH family glycoside/pentoside/hexuronide:cation symporter